MKGLDMISSLDVPETSPALHKAAPRKACRPCSSSVDIRDESHLIAMALAGDPWAFSRLVQPYLGLFAGGVHRILRNEQDTKLALQEAFISIHGLLKSPPPAGRFRAWAYRICLNEALTLRRSRMRGSLPGPENPSAGANPRTQIPGPPAALGPAQGTSLANVAHLPDEQRVVFILRQLEGMTTDEVARKLGLSRDQVRQRLHGARSRLQAVHAEIPDVWAAPEHTRPATQPVPGTAIGGGAG